MKCPHLTKYLLVLCAVCYTNVVAAEWSFQRIFALAMLVPSVVPDSKINYIKPSVATTTFLTVHDDEYIDSAFSAVTTHAAILSTDDHSTNSSNTHSDDGHAELFGSVVQHNMNISTYAIMLAIIVVSVNLIDLIFDHLLHITHDTPFAKMIHVIQKELMIVGVTAFIFKIITTSTDMLEGHALHALEFADTLVPLFSFCNCMLGLVLVFLSMRQADLWSRAFHMKLEQILNEYFEIADTWRHWLTPSILSPIINQLEFRIFHNIFCEMFNMDPSALAFDDYISYVGERFIYDIIKISPLKWTVFFLIAMLDYARVEYSEYFFHCDGDKSCLGYSSSVLFVIYGAALYLTTLIFAIISRHYELRVIGMKGIKSFELYPAYLQFMAESHKLSQRQRLKEDDLKKAINVAKARRQQNRNKRNFFTMDGEHSFSILRTSQAVTREVDTVSAEDVWQCVHESKQGVTRNFLNSEIPPPQQDEEGLKSQPNSVSIHSIPGNQSVEQKIDAVDPHTADESPDNVTADKTGQATDEAVLNITKPEQCNSHNASWKAPYRPIRNNTHFEQALAEHLNMPKIKRLTRRDMDNIYSLRLSQEDTMRSKRQSRIAQTESSLHLLRNRIHKIAPAETTAEVEQKKKSFGLSSFFPLRSSKPVTPDSGPMPWRNVPTPPLVNPSPRQSSPRHTPVNSRRIAEDHRAAEGLRHAVVEGLRVDTRVCGDIEMGLAPSHVAVAEDSSDDDNKSKKSNERKPFTEADNITYHASRTIDPNYLDSVPSDETRNALQTTDVNSETSSGKTTQRKEKVMEIFLFSSPKTYFHASQMLIVFVSVYIAVWLIYFLPSDIKAGWKVLTCLPGLMSFWNYSYVVRTAAFLKAIVHIDNQAVLEIVEQTESTKALRQTIRDKLLHQLSKQSSTGDQQIAAKELFNSIDVDEDGELSCSELAVYLNCLEIYFSHKKWKKVFRSLCIYCNKSVSLAEFLLFLFPTHDSVLAQEKSRLNKLKSKVSRRSMALVRSFKMIRDTTKNNKVGPDTAKPAKSTGAKVMVH